MVTEAEDRAEHDDTSIAAAFPADSDQIAERLSWTPKQRLDYLLDMLDFEERARRARRVP